MAIEVVWTGKYTFFLFLWTKIVKKIMFITNDWYPTMERAFLVQSCFAKNMFEHDIFKKT